MGREVKKLSAREAETINKPGYHADGDGLYLVVDKSGARRWAFIFHRENKRREMGLGRVSLREAREAAEEARRLIRAGQDPIAERRTARAVVASIPTFEAISHEVIAEAQARSTNAKVRYQWELLLGPRYCATILQKPVNEINSLDIERVLKPVWRAKPETGRKMLARLQRVFDYARVHLRDRNGILMQGNPAAWTDLRDRGFERSAKLTRGRQAALDYAHVQAFLQAVRDKETLAARALEVTLLTALRTGEVINAKWAEIDMQRKVWTIPPERLKDRRTRTEPHRIPLSTQVAELFETLPRLNAYVFPSQQSRRKGNDAADDAGRPLSNMAMLQLLKKMNSSEGDSIIWSDPKSGRAVTPHGLRATFRTWGEDASHARELLEEALGHQIGSAVERAYRRTDNLERRRTVMQAWADYATKEVSNRLAS